MRANRSIRWVVGLLIAWGQIQIAQADLKQTVEFHIAPQALQEALIQYSAQSRVQVTGAAEVIEGKQSPGIAGTLLARNALEQLLAGTDLTFDVINANTVIIRRIEDRRATSSSKGGEAVRLAELEQAPSQQDSASGSEASDPQLEEIVVTAQKREERLKDVPQSVSVLSANDLVRMGAVQFRDFANTVPGLSFTTGGAGLSQITLRGVSVGQDTSSTVGIYINDVSVGSSTAFANGGQTALDVNLLDLDRIEVLRGPQGTLYGASTMGGLIKYVTRQPSTAGQEVNLQSGLSSTQDGGIGYRGALSFNTPLDADNRTALRAGAFYSHDGGFIDNVGLGRDDVNRANIYGGRADLPFHPTDRFKVRIGALAQNISRNGTLQSDFELTGTPATRVDEQTRLLNEPFDQHFRLADAVLSYDLTFATLSSISAYQTIKTDLFADYSRVFGPLLGLSRVGVPQHLATDKFTQEIRLVSNPGARFDWIVGAFYAHESSENTQTFDPLLDASGQEIPNIFLDFSGPSRYEEYSGYGDLTWHLSSKLDISGGIRGSRNKQRFTQINSGIFLGGDSRLVQDSSESVFTYLANTRYRFTDRATGYLRFATGYRPGGPNFVVLDPVTGERFAPPTFDSDSLKSYEIGLKADTADRRLTDDAAVYFIDWSNVQILTSRAGLSAYINAPGGASVKGSEISLTARPVSDLSLTAALAYQDAYMNEADVPVPPLFPNGRDLKNRKGERLPNVPRFMGSLLADYTFPVSDLRPTVGATVRHVSERTTNFAAVSTYRLPQYTLLDLRTGVELGSFDVQLYVHNIFDKSAQLSAVIQSQAGVSLIEPRTMGIALSTRF